ncbi:MAG: hypothetical protein K2X91_17160 [Thermoleophilia bacterium]|nr:hypothetical protein [Thermoleophilia bacterium]
MTAIPALLFGRIGVVRPVLAASPAPDDPRNDDLEDGGKGPRHFFAGKFIDFRPRGDTYAGRFSKERREDESRTLVLDRETTILLMPGGGTSRTLKVSDLVTSAYTKRHCRVWHDGRRVDRLELLTGY